MLKRLPFPFCFIGGIAVQRWADPRATRDLDLSLLCGFGNEEQAVDALLKVLTGRIPEVRAFALRNRVVLLKTDTGVEVDIALAGLPFEEELQQRTEQPAEESDDAAVRMEKAIVDVMREGKSVTYDMGGTAGTREMGNAICEKLLQTAVK